MGQHFFFTSFITSALTTMLASCLLDNDLSKWVFYGQHSLPLALTQPTASKQWRINRCKSL